MIKVIKWVEVLESGKWDDVLVTGETVSSLWLIY